MGFLASERRAMATHPFMVQQAHELRIDLLERGVGGTQVLADLLDLQGIAYALGVDPWR